MADFYAMYLLDPDLTRELAPNVTAAFEQAVLEKPEIFEAIQEAHAELRRVDEEIDVSAMYPAGEPTSLIPDDVDDYTEAAKALVVRVDRVYRLQKERAKFRAREWKKRLNEEQLEDIGA